MIRHNALNRGLMFEWLQDCIEQESPAPSDEQIMGRFDLSTPEVARTLLADLVDRGLISITGTGETRQITLGRTRAAQPPATRPLPSVRKPVVPTASAQTNAEKIREIMARQSGGGSPPEVMPEQEPAPFAPNKPAIIPAHSVERLSPATLARTTNPQTTPQFAGRRKPAQSTSGGRRQLNIKLTHAQFEVLEAQALAVGEMPGPFTSALLKQFLEGGGVPAAPARKPRVRAAIIAAAIEANVELFQFLTDLMEMGFAVHQADLAEFAEAAE